MAPKSLLLALYSLQGAQSSSKRYACKRNAKAVAALPRRLLHRHRLIVGGSRTLQKKKEWWRVFFPSKEQKTLNYFVVALVTDVVYHRAGRSWTDLRFTGK